MPRVTTHSLIMREAASTGQLKDDATERRPRKRDAHGIEYRMNLPEGVTCGDCRYFDHCRELIGAGLHDEQCDWSPSRFRAA